MGGGGLGVSHPSWDSGPCRNLCHPLTAFSYLSLPKNPKCTLSVMQQMGGGNGEYGSQATKFQMGQMGRLAVYKWEQSFISHLDGQPVLREKLEGCGMRGII